MTPEAASAAQRLVGSAPDARDAEAVAVHVTSLFASLSQHLARLVGELGIRTLFARSLALAGTDVPCLRSMTLAPSEDPHDALERCLKLEAPDAAVAAGVHVLQTFIQLLERFIGAALVASLLHEVWPAVFPAAIAVVKETT